MSQLLSLPLPLEKIEEIKENGAIIDMNDLHFPNTEDQVKTAFVYLRNIGIAEKLDLLFNTCSYEQKIEFLKKYITVPYNVKNKEFVYTWIDILICGGHNGFLTEDELVRAREDLKDIGYKIYEFAYSLPLYAMYRFAMNDESNDELFRIQDFEKDDYDKFGANISNLVYHTDFILLVDNMGTYNPKFFTKYFTKENNDLFEAMAATPILATLNALATSEDNICKQILETEDE